VSRNVNFFVVRMIREEESARSTYMYCTNIGGKGKKGASSKRIMAWVNVKDALGHSPLHLAAEAGHKHAMKTLIRRGAFLEAKATDGVTPALAAAAKGQEDSVKFLLK